MLDAAIHSKLFYWVWLFYSIQKKLPNPTESPLPAPRQKDPHFWKPLRPEKSFGNSFFWESANWHNSCAWMLARSHRNPSSYWEHTSVCTAQVVNHETMTTTLKAQIIENWTIYGSVQRHCSMPKNACLLMRHKTHNRRIFWLDSPSCLNIINTDNSVTYVIAKRHGSATEVFKDPTTTPNIHVPRLPNIGQNARNEVENGETDKLHFWSKGNTKNLCTTDRKNWHGLKKKNPRPVNWHGYKIWRFSHITKCPNQKCCCNSIVLWFWEGIMPTGLACSRIEVCAPRSWPVKHIAATTLTIEHLCFFKMPYSEPFDHHAFANESGQDVKVNVGSVQIARLRGCHIVNAKCDKCEKTANTILVLPTRGNKWSNWIEFTMETVLWKYKNLLRIAPFQ